MRTLPNSQGAASLLERAHFVLGLFALWLLFSAGWRPLALPDEGRYVGVAWEMLQGDLLLPTLHGMPYFHKPPLMYWIDVAAMRLLGPNEFAARIAPAFGGWLMGAALWWHLRARAGAGAAALALGVLATMPFFFVGAQYANHDMLVAGWITVVVLCAVQAVDAEPPQRLRWVVAAWAAAALAVLSKGLIGIVLPALVLGPWLLAQRRWRDLVGLLHPAGLVVFLLLAAPWFVAMQRRIPGFLDYFFVEQHFRRFAATGFNNPRPFWFFVVVLPLLTLPWSLWLPATRRAWGEARTGRAALPLGLYAWWIVVVLLFFSLPRSKLVGYALPVLAPWAALLGIAAARGRAWRIALPLAALLCVGIVLGSLRWGPNSHRDLGLALRERWQPGDRVVLVDDAFFDIAFYARLREPPLVLGDWDDPEIPKHDNWRKELYDAARMAATKDAARLWRTARAGELLCGSGRVWFLAPLRWQPPPALPGLEPVASGRSARLWVGAARPAAGCP